MSYIDCMLIVRTIRRFLFVLGVILLGAVVLHAQTSDNNDASATRSQSSRPTTQGLNPYSGSSVLNMQDTNPLAETIIRILHENPSLLSEVKQQLTVELNRRGFAVSDSELTDNRIFSQLRTNEQFRNAVAERLKARGYLSESDLAQASKSSTQSLNDAEPQLSDEGYDTEMGEDTGADAEGASSNVSSGNQPRRAMKRSTLLRQQKPKPEGPELKELPNPYKDVPALADLYKQYSAKAEELKRFGEALFTNQDYVADNSPMDLPLGTDYVLGPGDGISLNLWGSVSQRLTRTLDHEGRISLPEAGSVLLAGHSVAEAQEIIEKALRQQFRDVSVDVSVNRLRRVRVYVVGDVARPGAYDISSLSTPLTALLAAGGPTRSGSLRTVQLYRGKTLVREIDLYDLMLHGVSATGEHLQSGDSLLVPPTGPQVAVAGMVRRPAIYELRSEETLGQVLDLAGGVLISGELSNVKVERVVAHQHRLMLNVQLPETADKQVLDDKLNHFVVEDGDRVTISPILPYSDKVVYLEGHVFRPGKFGYRDGMTVADLVPGFQDLLPEPADRAEIVRLEPPDYRPTVIGINLRSIIEKKEEAPALKPFDTVRVYGRYEFDAPTVSIYGEVLRPGDYPLSSGMSAADLVRLAGGFKRSAYRKFADLSSYSVEAGERVILDHREVEIGRALNGEEDTDVRLKPGDVLTIRQLGKWNEIGGSITVSGAILYPGRYGIQEGEKLSSVLRRAGGFLPDAYPTGAVLERAQVREISERSKQQLIDKLESQTAAGSRDAGEAQLVSQQRQRLVDRLKQTTANGRLVIRISSDVSQWQGTPADIEVRPGDTLFVPKKPNFILVSGQVYNPTAITFAPGRNAGWYLKQAGGATEFANRKGIFVIRANGSVVGKDSGGWWNGGVLSTRLEPGDTLVVPEKVTIGGAFWKDLAQSVQVVSAIAIAARVATSF